MVLLKQEPEPGKKTAPESVQIQTKAETVIDFNTIQENQELKALMQQRKAQYGVEKGVDIIAKSNESFKIGDITVSMKEILDKIRREPLEYTLFSPGTISGIYILIS